MHTGSWRAQAWSSVRATQISLTNTSLSHNRIKAQLKSVSPLKHVQLIMPNPASSIQHISCEIKFD